jgi:hypothetical protein
MEEFNHLKQALDLSALQWDQILAVIKGNAPQRQAVMEDESLSRHDKRARMEALREVTRSQIRALLTPEQQKKFDAMPHGHGPKFGGHGGENPPPQPPPAGAQPPASAAPAPAGPPPVGNP